MLITGLITGGISRFLYMCMDGMLVECRVTPCKILSVLICTPGWGETDQDNLLTLLIPVLWSTMALGGIKVVINLISSDIILVDHLTLLLMESTGRH